ncbi:hypothetical protein [uncultured Sulfitobacter sp.]|uniref:hypothetical protein n=1 Tax=uncultured Sulfitobacter sp. TaxID=191468 RepID=UPI00262C2F94|nr:hypothetical protein [uncultured Sulfitobacter sp.]
METCKLTTLALLIPFGALLSDTAAAYPEHFGQTSFADDRSSNRHCLLDHRHMPDVELNDAYEPAPSDSLRIRIAPFGSTVPQLERNPPSDTCRLDLERIDTN